MSSRALNEDGIRAIYDRLKLEIYFYVTDGFLILDYF